MNKVRHGQSGIIHWFLVSVVFFLGLAWLVVWAGAQVYDFFALDGFKKALAEANIDEIDTYYDKLNSRPILLNMFSGKNDLINQVGPMLNSAMSALNSINNKDFKDAKRHVALIKNNNSHSVKTINLNIGAEIERTINQLNESMENCMQLDQNIKQTKLQMSEAEREANKNFSLAGLLRKDFSEFLNIKVEDNSQTTFYAAGALKDLPQVPKIPDDISDLQEFKEILTEAGGKISLTGSDAPEQFASKLNELKNIGNQLVSVLTEISNTKDELASKIEQLQKDLDREIELAHNELKSLIMKAVQQFDKYERSADMIDQAKTKLLEIINHFKELASQR